MVHRRTGAMHHYPATVIFPRAGGMTTIWHGSSDPTQASPTRLCSAGSEKKAQRAGYALLHYACAFDAEKAVEELASQGVVVSAS